MCGFYYSSETPNQTRQAELKKIISKRGSDEINDFSFSNNYFLHARLKLNNDTITVQPIVSSKYVILYNGEIYNKKEISDKLNINARSDTELVAKLINLLPVCEVHSLLNGMYSIVVVDLTTNDRYLLVDKFGQKPLYYYLNGGVVQIASVQSLLNVRKFDKEGVRAYLHYGFVIPSLPLCSGVKRVPAGVAIKIDAEGNVKFLSRKISKGELSLSEINWEEYCESGYDVGVALSGGMDSSLVTSFYSKNYSGKKVAFTVDYLSNKLSELEQAKQYAQKCSVDLKVVKLHPDDIFDNWLEANSLIDEPCSDSALITTNALMKGISKAGVKCVLSGDGADERFSGYNRHILDFWLSRVNPTIRLAAAQLVDNKIGNNLSHFFIDKFFTNDPSSKVKRLILALKNTDPNKLASIFHNTDTIESSYVPRYGMFNFELNDYLIGNNLTRMDRISLGHGVEVRAPFLDDYLIDESSSKKQRKPIIANEHSKVFGAVEYVKKGFSYETDYMKMPYLLESAMRGRERAQEILSVKISEINTNRQILAFSSFDLFVSKYHAL